MKSSLLLALACLWAVSSFADEIPSKEASSRVSSATVYADRALVTRTFTAQISPGPQSIVIPDLPANLIDESVRVTGKGTAGVTMSGVKVREKFLEEAAQDTLRKLQGKIDEIENRIAALNDRKGVLDDKRKFVQAISQKTTESIAENIAVQRPTLADWTGMVSFVDKTLDEINSESRNIDMQLKDLENKKSVIEMEMRGFQNAVYKSQKSVVVDIDAEQPGSISMELSYMIIGAGWSPVYDIRASSENDTISVVFMANVRQITGENWDNVELELSTGRPFIGAVPRILNPWYVSVASSQPLDFGFKGGRSGEIGHMVDGVLQSPEEIAKQQAAQMKQVLGVETASADVSQQMISTSFTLRQPESIPSNNDPKKVSVKVMAVAGEKEYYAVPRFSSYAYLKSKVINKTDFPLLPGSASVFFDGSFVSNTKIPLVVPTESFDLYLGIDESIKLKRELVEKFMDRTGVLNKKHQIDFAYKITAENYRKEVKKITILDQIPVSQDDRIEVDLKKISPEPHYKNDDREKGILRWVEDLQPGAKTEMTFAYRVKYPQDLTVNGLQ